MFMCKHTCTRQHIGQMVLPPQLSNMIYIRSLNQIWSRKVAIVHLFYLSACQNDSALPDGKHVYNSRIVVTILNLNTNDAIMQHGGPHYGGLVRCFGIIRPPVLHSATKHDSTIVSLDQSSIRGQYTPGRADPFLLKSTRLHYFANICIYFNFYYYLQTHSCQYKLNKHIMKNNVVSPSCS